MENTENLPVESVLEQSNQALDKINSSLDATITVADSALQMVEAVSRTADSFARVSEANAKRDVAIKKLDNELEKIHVVEKTINEDFKQRDRTIDISENVIQKGLESKNLDYVIAGLNAMTNVVTKSPLDSLKNQKSIGMDDDSIIEI